MLKNQFYRRIIEMKVHISNVPGYDAELYTQLMVDAVYAAARCSGMTGNGICDEDDHYQNMMLKALEKPGYYSKVNNLRAAVFSTTRNQAINSLKKMRDWTGTGKKEKLSRIPMEEIQELPVSASDSTEDDEAERSKLVRSVLADIRKALKRQMRTESVRSGSDHSNTIKETAKICGIAERTVTSHRTRVRTYATEHHAESRRQLFRPHHSKKTGHRGS